MKLKKTAAAAVSCIFMFCAAFGAYAMNSEKNIQETSSASNDVSSTAEYAGQIADMVNSERASYGLAPLKLSPKLCQAANIRAEEIKQYFSHTRPDGTSCFTAITDLGIKYSFAAENIAYGQKTPKSVMNAWMNSDGHRANILNENMEYIGVGAAYENGIYYWTQFFAASADLPETAPETDKPAETTVTAAPETDPVPETTDVTEKRPEETRPAETEKIPEVSAKPQETSAPSGTKQPENTKAPSSSECKPCETQCSTGCDGSLSCTPVTPCETQCSTGCDGSLSCTPVTPCETQCSTGCDGSLSCTPVTPCETQCSTGCDGSLSCTPNNSCSSNNSDSGSSYGCPLQGGAQGQNILEWLIPKMFNSGNNNTSSSNSRSSSGSCPYSSPSYEDPVYSSGSCWGSSVSSYSSSGSCPYSSSGQTDPVYSVGSCWGD